MNAICCYTIIVHASFDENIKISLIKITVYYYFIKIINYKNNYGQKLIIIMDED